MDKSFINKNPAKQDEVTHFNRSRSFKSKQLVRSQAIRESQSPPRTVSPAVRNEEKSTSDDNNVNNNKNIDIHSNDTKVDAGIVDALTTNSDVAAISRCSDIVNYSSTEFSELKKQPVEIQITSGSWDLESQNDQRQRTKRWLGQKNLSESTRNLLSNNPRVACVCGTCAACPHCRGRRRRRVCPVKQDSGIGTDDYSDCYDADQTGVHEGAGNNASLDVEDHTFYCKCPERNQRSKTMSLCRADSDDRLDPTGPELVNFIKETLNKNHKDRVTLLKIEKELHSLINDTGRCIVRFPVMTSYNRMLVHRCATLFQLSHNIDQINKNAVLVSKIGTSGGRLPCTSFEEWCTVAFPSSPAQGNSLQHEQNAKSILKRACASLEECDAGAGRSQPRSKSLEQREKDYQRVRRRIFCSDTQVQDDSQWPWNAGPIKLLTPEGDRKQLLKVQSLESSGPPPSSRNNGSVSKSHSFSGGVPPQQNRLLSRQGDLASSSWRLSPSSSGYKTLSLRSTDSVTPSPTGGASPEPLCTEGVMWAVTDLCSVPPGALVIHPQTGRPLTNADGSVYHFDPANPPILYDPHAQYNKENAERRRGKLEKQHSFIDNNECECQPIEDGRKCWCEMRKQDTNSCQQVNPHDKESNTKPSTPIKNISETPTAQICPEPDVQNVTYEQPTNQSADEQQRAYELANQVQPYEIQAVQTQVYENQKNQTQVYENQASQMPVYENQTSQMPIYENHASQMPVYENQAAQMQAYENPNNNETQRIYGTVAELANQRAMNEQHLKKYPSQEYHELQYPQYHPGYTGEEIISQIQQNIQNPYLQQEYNMHMMAQQAKVNPMPQDPNIRPVSITNMMYPAPMQAYPYVNQCRIDPQLQPIYQPVMQPQEELKPVPQPHNPDNTFRIDASYPYVPLDYTAACGTCDNNLPTHRTYPVQLAGEAAQVPLHGVLLQQPAQPYPVADGSWPGGKVLVPELVPVLHYNLPYPHYNVVYPQMIPQPYPVCQPVYPLMEKPEPPHRNSLSKPRIGVRGPTGHNTEQPRLDDITAKIQQIKDQMEQLHTKDRRNDGWKKRNNGNGILGSYPSGNYNGRFSGGPTNEELSQEAKDIVDSIRSMNRNTYQSEPRPDGRRRFDRGDRDFYRQSYFIRQMSPGTWCRRSPGPVHPVMPHPPRRPFTDTRYNSRR